MRYEAHQLQVDGERAFDGSDITTGRRFEREQVGRLLSHRCASISRVAVQRHHDPAAARPQQQQQCMQ